MFPIMEGFRTEAARKPIWITKAKEFFLSNQNHLEIKNIWT